MDTLTTTKSSTITNTKLALATLAALGAGGLALATAPLGNMTSISNVISCRPLSNGVEVVKKTGENPTVLTTKCSNNKYYKYTCATPKKLRTVVQQPCPGNTITPALPDLIVENFSFSPPDPGYGTSHKKISVTIKNIGQSDAIPPSSSATVIPVQTYWFKDGNYSPGEGINMQKQDGGALILKPGEVLTMSYNIDLSSPVYQGATSVKLSVDDRNGQGFISESNEGNNQFKKDFVLDNLPDLRFKTDSGIQGINFHLNRSAVEFTILNTGNTPSNVLSKVRATWLDSDQTVLPFPNNQVVDSLASQTERSLSTINVGNAYGLGFYIIPTSRARYLRLEIDPDNLINEMDEGNNTLQIPIPEQYILNIDSSVAKTCDEAKQHANVYPYYFDTCKSNHDAVCLDKFTLIYQGCGAADGGGCTSYNTNSDRNISCAVRPLFPDLTVNRTEFNLNAREVAVYVSNQGQIKNNIASASQTGIFVIWKDQNYRHINSETADLPEITPGDTLKFIFDYPPHDDSRFLKIKLDDRNLIAESNENNNIMDNVSVPFNPPSLPATSTPTTSTDPFCVGLGCN